MTKHHDSRKWHQQKRWVLGSLLLFPPLGIPLLWLTRWPRASKVGGTLLSGLLLLSALAGESSEPTTAAAQPPIEVTEASVQTRPALLPAYEDAIAEATAATAATTTAESSADWTSVADRWQRAISLLGDIPINSDDYGQVQVKIAEYERNYEYAISQRDVIESATIAQRKAEEQAVEEQAAAQQAAITAAEAQALSVFESQGGYVSGTCKALRASGVGSNFRPGDANYTAARDRDNDGIACES